MTTEQWLLAAVSFSWSGQMLSLAVGKWIQKTEHQVDLPLHRLTLIEAKVAAIDQVPLLVYRITEMEHRIEQAGEKMSDCTSAIQGLPEQLRQSFVTREEWDATERRRRADA